MNWPDDFVNKIICGNCLEVMKKVPNESIDIIYADPPFNVGKDYGKFNDKKSEKEYWIWLKEIIIEIFRILKRDTRFYIFHTDKGSFKLKPICEKIGFKYSQTLIWYRPNLGGGGVGPRISGDWHYMHEQILLFHKGKRTNMLSSPLSNCYSVQVVPAPQTNFKDGRDHVAQKPLKLMERLIVRTPGQLILFPFLGSGIDTRAAKNLKRDFIGIEINPDYVKIANERLAQGVL